MKKKSEAVKPTMRNACGRREAAYEPGKRSLLLAILSVLKQAERLREGKTTDEPFTEFEKLLGDMVRIGADGLERITGESLLPGYSLRWRYENGAREI